MAARKGRFPTVGIGATGIPASGRSEQLGTINAEPGGRIEAPGRAGNDLQNLFDSSQIAIVFLDRTLAIHSFTRAASSYFSLGSADIGRPFTDLTGRLDVPGLKDSLAAVFAGGDIAEHTLAPDGDGRHHLMRLIPHRGEAGRIEGVVVTLVDVTTLAEAAAHQRVLISELNHRVKNMLAVVISIANHTLDSAASPEAFNTALVGRLHAMARAYSLLSRTNWTEASVARIVGQETAAFGSDRFDISGPELRLKPRQGLSLGMAMHELSTNAAKYGALSKPKGKVAIHWRTDGNRFRLSWKERGGPPVAEPDGEGFGMTLLKGEIEYQLGGEVETSFDPKGLVVSITFEIERWARPRRKPGGRSCGKRQGAAR